MNLSGKKGSFTTRIKRLFGYSESSKRSENILFSAVLFMSLLVFGLTNPLYEKVDKTPETNKKLHEFNVRYKSEVRGLNYRDAVGSPGTGKPISISCDNCEEDLSLHILNDEILDVPKGLCFPPAISELTVVDSFFLMDEDLALKLYGKKTTAYVYYLNNEKNIKVSVADAEVEEILNNSFTNEFDTILVRNVTLKINSDKPAPLCFLNGKKMEVENQGDWPAKITALARFDSIMIISGNSAQVNYGVKGENEVWYFYHTLEMFRSKEIWAGTMLYIINGDEIPAETPNLEQVVKDKIGKNKILRHCLYFGTSATELFGDVGSKGVKTIETEIPEEREEGTKAVKSKFSVLEKSFKVYPNPMEKKGTIEFILDKSGDVRIMLYSTDGKLVKVIDEEQKLFGRHKINWSVGDLPAGIYQMQVQTEGESFMKPVVIE